MTPLQESIAHWKRMLNSEECVSRGTLPCALCFAQPRNEIGEPDCMSCPVHGEGEGCNKRGSIWHLFKKAYNKYIGWTYNYTSPILLKDLAPEQIEELKPRMEAMLNLLEGLEQDIQDGK